MIIENGANAIPQKHEKEQIHKSMEDIDGIFKNGKFLSEASQLERDLVNKRFQTEVKFSLV